jgi:hypothetical protein
MDGTTNRSRSEKMSTANQDFNPGGSLQGTTLVLLSASLLIFLGVIFQLGQLGYGHIGPGDFWLFSTVVTSVWNILSMRLDVPAMAELIQFWPLGLVGVGLAILLVKR